ncbi:hypothetical protein M0R45_016117 [Rubus argutus]|uniref:Uncharacterized protein n=1 Tax=Rubus argutus TaxID=59490 RepID=A0AAW1XR24_RUBAR
MPSRKSPCSSLFTIAPHHPLPRARAQAAALSLSPLHLTDVLDGGGDGHGEMVSAVAVYGFGMEEVSHGEVSSGLIVVFGIWFCDLQVALNERARQFWLVP